MPPSFTSSACMANQTMECNIGQSPIFLNHWKCSTYYANLYRNTSKNVHKYFTR